MGLKFVLIELIACACLSENLLNQGPERVPSVKQFHWLILDSHIKSCFLIRQLIVFFGPFL